MVIEFFMEWVETAPVKKREAAAAAMARAYLKKGVSEEDREDLEAALTVLLEDNSPSVRLAIAETFGAFSSAPRHIISALASDITEISIIVLSRSPVFHDSELIAAVRGGEEKAQIAISCRPWISPNVVATICKYGCKDANLGLLMNPAADFTPEDLYQMASRFGTETDIRIILLDRDDLETRTRHLLISKLGEALGGLIRKKSWIPEARLERTLDEAFDRASIIFAANARERDISSVVRNLMESDRLTVAFLIRAICMGNIALVASALSELSGIRFPRVESILTRNRESAFRAVYQRAGLPDSAYIVFTTALTAWRRLLSSKSSSNKARMPFIVTREVLEAYSANPESVSHELVVLLRRLAAETARENSRAKAEEIAQRGKQEPAAIASEVEEAEILSEEEPLAAVADEHSQVPAVEVETIAANDDVEPGLVGEDLEFISGTLDQFDPSILDGADFGMNEKDPGFSDGLLHAPRVRAA